MLDQYALRSSGTRQLLTVESDWFCYEGMLLNINAWQPKFMFKAIQAGVQKGRSLIGIPLLTLYRERTLQEVSGKTPSSLFFFWLNEQAMDNSSRTEVFGLQMQI